jgi:UDP:flavonoid glycosyltransferase YjiC (YdhE family)
VPSIIVPFMGDQPFWGKRIADLGVGPQPIPRKRLSVAGLTAAISAAVTDADIGCRAAALGQQLRAEHGVGSAVALINHVMLGQS